MINIGLKILVIATCLFGIIASLIVGEYTTAVWAFIALIYVVTTIVEEQRANEWKNLYNDLANKTFKDSKDYEKAWDRMYGTKYGPRKPN